MRFFLYVRPSHVDNVYALAVATYGVNLVFSKTQVDTEGMQWAMLDTCADEVTDIDRAMIQLCFSAGWVYGYYVEVMPCSQV